MIGEPTVLINLRAARSPRQSLADDLVVDPPTHVLRPGLPAIRPPGVLVGLVINFSEGIDVDSYTSIYKAHFNNNTTHMIK